MAETGPRRLGFVTRLLDRVTRGQRRRLKAEKIVQRSGAVSPRAAETLGQIRLSDLKSARERLARSSGRAFATQTPSLSVALTPKPVPEGLSSLSPRRQLPADLCDGP